MKEPTKQTVIITPLDWGLGHLTRCIPIIEQLLKNNFQVVVCANHIQKEFLLHEDLDVIIEPMKGYEISYPKNGKFMLLSMLKSLPKFLKMAFYEPHFISLLVEKYQASLVISDNRFFSFSKKVPSIYITHQMLIKFPKWAQNFEIVGVLAHRFIQKNYIQVWIPDFEPFPSLGGKLSHINNPKSRFIGTLSRFHNTEQRHIKEYDILDLISGPEPQRTILEEKLHDELNQLDLKSAMVLGKPQERIKANFNSKVKVYPHLASHELQELILKSNLVVSRSGYSTVMDLEKLSAKALFIPTPGQTEQEYLAELYQEHGIAQYQKQDEINLNQAILSTQKYLGFSYQPDKHEYLMELVHEILKSKEY